MSPKVTFESLTAASSKKHVSKRADKHRSGFRTNSLSVFPTLFVDFFFLGRGLDSVNFPPRTLISWWTFTQARRATPYLPANRLNEVEREKREKGYSLRFGSTRRFFGRPLMVMGILSPESRSISGKRVLTEGQEDITKRKIELTVCITLVGEKFIYFFLRV